MGLDDDRALGKKNTKLCLRNKFDFLKQPSIDGNSEESTY